jgi:hypothetical protein
VLGRQVGAPTSLTTVGVLGCKAQLLNFGLLLCSVLFCLCSLPRSAKSASALASVLSASIPENPAPCFRFYYALPCFASALGWTKKKIIEIGSRRNPVVKRAHAIN